MSACSLKYPRRASTVPAYRPSRGDSAASGEGMGLYYKGVANLLSRVSAQAKACTVCARHLPYAPRDRKSTRLNSSHSQISYAVFCLKKQKEPMVVSGDAMKRKTSNRNRTTDRNTLCS